MTPKERVLKRNPQAHCRRDGKRWLVYPAPFGPMAVRPIGEGTTARGAWRDAAANR